MQKELVAYVVVAVMAVAGWVSQAMADTLIISASAENKVTFIDLDTGALLGRVESPGRPHEVAVSPDGLRVAVASFGSNTIHLFDVQSRELIKTLDLGANQRPHGLAWLSNTEIVATTEGSDTVVFIDIGGGAVVSADNGGERGGHMVYPTPDGAELMVPNMGSGSVSVYSPESRRRTRVIATGAIAQGASFSDHGRIMWVTNSGDDDISMVERTSGETIARIPAGDRPVRVWITPDERHAVVANYLGNTLTIIDIAERARLKTVEFPEYADNAGPVYLLSIDDGATLLVGLIGPDVFALLDTETFKLTGYMETYGEIDGMDRSPY